MLDWTGQPETYRTLVQWQVGICSVRQQPFEWSPNKLVYDVKLSLYFLISILTETVVMQLYLIRHCAAMWLCERTRLLQCAAFSHWLYCLLFVFVLQVSGPPPLPDSPSLSAMKRSSALSAEVRVRRCVCQDTSRQLPAVSESPRWARVLVWSLNLTAFRSCSIWLHFSVIRWSIMLALQSCPAVAACPSAWKTPSARRSLLLPQNTERISSQCIITVACANRTSRWHDDTSCLPLQPSPGTLSSCGLTSK